MAPRPIWKGYLKLSLVTCAVELTAATTHSEKVSFRILNRATGNTVRREYVDSKTGKPVDEKHEIKGYEIGDDTFVEIEESEIEAVQIESSHMLDLDGFVEKSTIEAVYLDTPYYVTPADEMSEEAFGVIRAALARKKMAALARIVLFRRERPVVLEPLDKGMLLTTLRYGDTVRRPDTVFGEIKDVTIDKEMLDLATQIITKRKTSFDPSKFDDRYEEALLALIEAKKSGKKAPPSKAAPKPSNVVDLFDALKKSLAADGGRAASRKPSKRSPAPRGKATAAKRKSA
ncbi:non-homologous end joining protein Ku [Mesorhizobium sp. L-8-10]|uniref:non-homologous end joining protein Ku n=1 Tax=Mesorhizobium sp. L-8-10 TaxID=2744523 RepID=UPI001926C2BA|nr:Ku protein [Mesorhizobium sp. L-8-10]